MYLLPTPHAPMPDPNTFNTPPTRGDPSNATTPCKNKPPCVNTRSPARSYPPPTTYTVPLPPSPPNPPTLEFPSSFLRHSTTVSVVSVAVVGLVSRASEKIGGACEPSVEPFPGWLNKNNSWLAKYNLPSERTDTITHPRGQDSRTAHVVYRP